MFAVWQKRNLHLLNQVVPSHFYILVLGIDLQSQRGLENHQQVGTYKEHLYFFLIILSLILKIKKCCIYHEILRDFFVQP